ncbi:enterochelin esterase [Teredinibacter haidensis]|uniref:enterochelin esterase n=1 Tax=Teredinibacter haidensis TaxID=2731755 RepID=UPI0009F89568|nr:enterochelin esterase [Teredinibacter haidensis]
MAAQACQPEFGLTMDKRELMGCEDELCASDIGSAHWWRRIECAGTPITRPLAGGHSEVTFLWRDPGGGGRTSTTRQVYIDAWSLTPHPVGEFTCLIHIDDTDVWFWRVCVPGDWCGSYFFVPDNGEHVAPNELAARRDWWLQRLADSAQSDPLNLLPGYLGLEGRPLSQLNLSPNTSGLEGAQYDRFYGGVRALRWHSRLLGNRRDIWLYTTGDGADLPLVILLDGGFWAKSIPIKGALDSLTQRGYLLPASYLLLDAIDAKTRYRELACNARFWQALQEELLPRITQQRGFSLHPKKTLVAGQSLGGLAACYAGLFYPQCFDVVLSQSGSFWWRGESEPGGSLMERVAGMANRHPLQFYLEVGCYEDTMLDDNRAMRDTLIKAGHQVNYHEFRGGHDWVCWREGLLRGLQELLPPSILENKP